MHYCNTQIGNNSDVRIATLKQALQINRVFGYVVVVAHQPSKIQTTDD